MFEVKVTSEQSTILQKLAFKKGFTWDGRQKVSYTDKPHITVMGEKDHGYNLKLLYGSKSMDWAGPNITFEEAFEYLLNDVVPPALAKKKPTIQVGSYEVSIRENGDVKFGCTLLSNKMVEEILVLREDVMKNPDKYNFK